MKCGFCMKERGEDELVEHNTVFVCWGCRNAMIRIENSASMAMAARCQKVRTKIAYSGKSGTNWRRRPQGGAGVLGGR